jgi:hypothetical protein
MCADAGERQVQFPAELTDSTLRDGVWAWYSDHRLPHQRQIEVVRIRLTEDTNDITILFLFHTRESYPRHEIVKYGPYPIRVADGILHIEEPNRTRKHSYRFDGELFKCPALIRTDARTFNMTNTSRSGDREETWSYTWSCSSNPSEKSTGTANLKVRGPEIEVVIPCAYAVEASSIGPALVFRRVNEFQNEEDRITWNQHFGFGLKRDRIFWNRQFIGPMTPYGRTAIGPFPMKGTYSPADEKTLKLIANVADMEPFEMEPSKSVTANDGA